MPYITKKQLKTLDVALTMADSLINNNTVAVYRGVPTKWSEISTRAGVTLLELYKKQKQDKEKVRQVVAERRKKNKNYARGVDYNKLYGK